MIQKGSLYILLLTAFVSCTSLQYRRTDTEIKTAFDALNIPTTISYFDVNSLDLRIRIQEVRNENSDISIVFLHGSPSSLTAWNGYLKDSLLIRKASLYAIDRPGYGYSNFGNEMPSIKEQARVLNELIQAKNIRRIIVVGTSYGGPLAARMAVLNKDIEAVVMISPAIDPTIEKNIWASRLTQWWLTRWMVPTGYRVAGDEKTMHAAELSKLEIDWPRLQTPVLHIHGDIDHVVPYENIYYSEKTFSNIRLITMPNKGHEIAWRHLELVRPYLLEVVLGVGCD